MDKNQVAVAVFNKRAELYQEKYMDVGMYKDSFDLFCKQLEYQSRVLEVACGPGNVTKFLLDHRPDLDILGIDLAPNMVALAKANNPTAEFEVKDCRKILDIGKGFHGIMCAFFFPYLNKEEALQFIADAAKLLPSKGALYISTMEDNYSNSRIVTSSAGDEVFMYFHEAGYLTEALQNNGFDILSLQRISYPGVVDTTTTDLLLVAVKQ